MKKTYWKNIFREIGSTKNRFLAILIIVALGVCMFTGLMVTSPDMLRSGDIYFDQSNFMDLRVISTLGLTQRDVEEIEKIEGVQQVEAVKSVDCLLNDNAGELLAARLQALPEDIETAINQPTVIEGQLPKNPGECAILNTAMGKGVQIGDTLTLAEDNGDMSESLSSTKWKVVGIVSVPTNFSIDAETVSVGDGQADIIAFAPQEDFSSDVYTTAYMTVQGAKELDTYSQAYEDYLQPVIEQLEDLGLEQSEIRKNEVITQAQEELDKAKAEYETKKADVEAQLQLAEAELEKGRLELEENEAKLQQGNMQWQQGTTQLAQKKTELAQLLTQKQQEITQARQQITEGQRQLELAKTQLESYKNQYQQAVSAQQQVESGEQQLQQAKQQLELAQKGVELAEKMLPGLQQTVETAQQAAQTAQTQAQQAEEYRQQLNQREDIQQGLAKKQALDAVLAQYPQYTTIEELLLNPPADMPSEQLTQLQADYQQYQTAKTQVDAADLAAESAKLRAEQLQQAATQAQTAYESTKTSLEQGKQSIESSNQLIAQKEQQLQQAKDMLAQYADLLEKAPAMIEEGEKQVLENEAKLQDAQAQLEDGTLALSLAPSQAQLEFENAQKLLDDSKKQLEEGQVQLEEGKKQWEEGKEEFETQKQEAETQLNEAEDKLIDAQREIDKIDSCEWYVLDRNTIVPYATFKSNADKLASIATVFPVFFFLVAALVALTTMTRMVDENRTQIGTLKALGYGETAITAKYLLYAATATFAGGFIGLLLGFYAIPALLWNAYSAMYRLPKFYMQLDWKLAVIALAAAILCTAGATINACHSTLKEKPAQLLMPKAPKAGKRILLERITPLWSRMKFTHKVTARNLFRYKKRFFMTVVGIAGCTALLMIGFGIQDSIMDLMDTQYKQLWHYDLSIGLNNPSALEGRRGIEDILQDKNTIKNSLVLYQKNMDVSKDGSETVDVTITVPQQQEDMAEFITLRNRQSKKEIPFENDSVVLTEKAAEILGVKAGDTITVDVEGKEVSLQLTAIAENYLGSNLYISPSQWEQIQPEPQWNTVFAQTLCEDETQRSQLSQKLLEKDDVQSAVFTQESSQIFRDAISNINNVVIVIILFAALLAVVVLYNLININIGERKKELATIKVLGFFDNEVRKYIFREIDVLSIVGALCGLVLGVPLHLFVIKTVEIDQMMFIRNINASSYLYSFVLTMVFTGLVSLIMRKSLKDIDMVESMKAPE